ncbi:MAG: hypothetical protein B6245_21475 [Desulfobacteraceae bacterium 4572_88]|nr:MAG: hypothetical protein B6245_21475 [Desulfobacteraceae bacterium 4572_88]
MMRNVKVEFTAKNLTGNAGLISFGRFIKKLGLSVLLFSHIGIVRASNADYRAKDVVIMLLLEIRISF